MTIETLSLVDARLSDADLVVELSDGRTITTPIFWYPRLQRASREEREDFELRPWGMHWPHLDEDLSLDGMLNGRPAIVSAK